MNTHRPLFRPLVTVVVPTFNAERTIAETLRTVMDQTYRNIQIIVVDDASIDNTTEIVESLRPLDGRIQLLRRQKNSGLPAVPRNAALSHALGEWVAFIDADDTWVRHKLEWQLTAVEAHPDLDLVHGPLWERARGAPLRGLVYLPDPVRRRGGKGVLVSRNVIQCSSVLVSLRAVRAAGGFNESQNLRSVEDYELWYRLARSGYRFGYLPGVCGTYLVHSQGISKTEDWISRHQTLNDKYGHQINLDAERGLLRIARRVSGFPRAAYFNLMEAPIRRRLKIPPRVFKDRIEST